MKRIIKSKMAFFAAKACVAAVVLTAAQSCNAADDASAKMAWVKLSPATSPPARFGPGMAYDALEKSVVVFGGLGDRERLLNDTWTYNGSTWVQQDPANSPPKRQQSGMAYDLVEKNIVLFGGIGQEGTSLSDTWVWNGADWTRANTLSEPASFPYAVPLFVDPINGHVDLFTANTNGVAETWQWSGSNWTQLFPSTSPPARISGTAALDKKAHVVVLYGGTDALNNPLTDTWTFDGVNWTEQMPATNPGSTQGTGAIYDSQLKGIIMPNWFGNGETWEWTGVTWNPIVTVRYPLIDDFWGIAPNPANGLPLIFAGSFLGVPTSGTWEFVVVQ